MVTSHHVTSRHIRSSPISDKSRLLLTCASQHSLFRERPVKNSVMLSPMNITSTFGLPAANILPLSSRRCCCVSRQPLSCSAERALNSPRGAGTVASSSQRPLASQRGVRGGEREGGLKFAGPKSRRRVSSTERPGRSSNRIKLAATTMAAATARVQRIECFVRGLCCGGGWRLMFLCAGCYFGSCASGASCSMASVSGRS